MESILAEALVKKVCEMAVQQVANEVSIVWNFTQDFEWLMSKIRQINYFLNEAGEMSSTQKDSVKEWLQSVRDIAWEAEDILKICAVDSMYATIPQFCSLSCNQLITRYQMGRRIRKVKARFSSVTADIQLITAPHTAVSHREEAESSQRRQLKRLSLLPSDSKPVGIQYKIDSMVNLIENPQFQIIAVVEWGGWARPIFFSMSTMPKREDEDLCKSINMSGISEVVAAESIYGFILGKSCLIVLDDVWRASREGDFLTRLGIPTGANSQCKILVSTRSRELYVFPGSEGNIAPEYLKEVAVNIVKECGNLPLAIKTTAASLANTTRPREWQSKFDKLKKVSNPNDPVMGILRLSYDSLPAHLKACFAYLAFFPEDEQIECEYLIYLWMGEGLILAGENPWDCLDQLANLCLVEVWEDEWLTKYCKIHDLLLDLAIFISRENKCAFGVEDAFSELRSVNNTGGGRWCRLFLAKKDIDERAISERCLVSPTLVRTLSLSRNTKIGGNIPAMFFSGMRVLRVLDLSNTNISALPACVGKMKLLRVLNLSRTKIEMLPECVRHLKSLSYLNVSTGAPIQIPKWISELRCLQHLEGRFERMPKEISKLESLRTLRISGGYWLSLSVEEEEGMLRIEDAGKMSEIEEIEFLVSDEAQLKRMEEGMLAPLEKLRRLKVKNAIDGMQGESESDLPQFPERMSAMRDLEHLSLYSFAVPSWICCLANLTYLYLFYCDCSNYPELQALPNLVSLTLWVNKRCRELPKAFGKSGGFPHLRFLGIYYFDELEEFPEMEDGGMAWLEKLGIYDCKKLNKVGDGLERLKRLKEINLRRSGIDELRETLKEGGIYWKRIKAINPHITIVGI
ncbi:hypothetical protein SUGI_1111620 [Cryptomeria japonica]|nr:hypothetical protein SUGI_1111620 [Cryptomeria japonica]